MLNILYSFNKRGYEAAYWTQEIQDASTENYRFIPFNHDRYLDPRRYIRAQLLDDLYYRRDGRLMHLYADFENELEKHSVHAVVVDNCFPYHPDYLRKLQVYKVLRTSDGPLTAYDRDFAYLHAYDHVLYHSPAYSRDMGMEEKLKYCGAKNVDFWPLALFDAVFDPTKSGNELLEHDRDIDIIFIGALHVNKMPLLACVKKHFGRRCRIYGLAGLKKNMYFNLKYGFPGWIRPVSFDEYVPLYQRSKIGFNVHNRGDFTVGSYRLFELPGNGVMQISDGGPYLNDFFKLDDEIIGYSGADDLVRKLEFYLENDDLRRNIALNGYRRVMRDHRFRYRMNQLGAIVESGLKNRKPNRIASCQEKL